MHRYGYPNAVEEEGCIYIQYICWEQLEALYEWRMSTRAVKHSG